MSGLPIIATQSPLSPCLKRISLSSLPPSIIYRLLFPKTTSSGPSVTLRNVSKFLSSAGGLDKGLMAMQYTPKLVIPILIMLLRFLSRSSTTGKSPAGNRASLRQLLIGSIEGLSNLSSTVGDTRTLMRIFGLIHTLAYHPSTPSITIEYAQSLLLLLYYPLEHIVYLHSHSIIPRTLIPQSTSDNLSIWSCRFWAGYVVLDLYASYITMSRLRAREDALKRRRKEVDVEEVMEKKGYSLDSMGGEGGSGQVGDASASLLEEAESLRSDWADWADGIAVNIGYAPLTIHWSLPGGLWTNPAWTGAFGTLACFAGVRRSWRGMEGK